MEKGKKKINLRFIRLLMRFNFRYLQLLGAKQRVMELMTHEDANVKYHALSATQKYFAMT